MKICSQCNQTYTDDSLNFCLNDGGVLKPASPNAPDAPPATVLMSQPRPTDPNRNFSSPTLNQPNWGSAPQSATPTPLPKPKSKAWIWILGILGGGALLVIIGVVGLIALVANMNEAGNSSPKNTNPPKNTNSPPKNTNSASNNNSAVVKKDDFSEWNFNDPSMGLVEHRNGEFTMSSKAAGYYFVLLANKDFLTSDLTTKVTVKNTTGKLTRSGFGLVVNSDPNVPLARDYTFLIDSVNQSYRIAEHTANKETTIVNWTRFPAIRSGTQTNELQVKDESGKMTFFINGQMATSVKDTANYKNGIAGIYASDAVPIAFSDLEIRK